MVYVFSNHCKISHNEIVQKQIINRDLFLPREKKYIATRKMMNYIRTKTYMYDIFIVIYLYECHKLLFLLNVIYYVYKTFEPHMDAQVT